MSNGDTPTKKRRNKKNEDTTVTVTGVSASGTSDTGGQSTVEARGDAGGEASADSPIQTARKLLQKMVQWVRKVLRIDS